MVKLNYRGVSYQTKEYSLSTSQSTIRAKFRGNAYNVSRSIVPTMIQPSLEVFRYRGVLYQKNFDNAKIKGQVDNQEAILQN